MPAIVVTCPHCGAAVPTPFGVAPGEDVTDTSFRGLAVVCMRCGATINVGDVDISYVDGVFKAIAAAQPSAAQIEALLRALSTEKARTDPEAAKAAVEEEVPSLAPFLTDWYGLDPATWRELIPAVLFALGYVVAFLLLPTPSGGMRAFEALYNAAKIAFGKSPERDPGKAADAGKAAAKRAMPRTKNQRKAERRSRR